MNSTNTTGPTIPPSFDAQIMKMMLKMLFKGLTKTRLITFWMSLLLHARLYFYFMFIINRVLYPMFIMAFFTLCLDYVEGTNSFTEFLHITCFYLPFFVCYKSVTIIDHPEYSWIYCLLSGHAMYAVVYFYGLLKIDYYIFILSAFSSAGLARQIYHYMDALTTGMIAALREHRMNIRNNNNAFN